MAQNKNVRNLQIFGLLSSVLTLSALVFYDTFPMTQLAHDDFCMLFYVAGTMVRNGHGSELYLSAGSHSLLATPFNLYAHRLFPQLSPDMNAVFLYPPMTSLIFVPFSIFPARGSLIAWQITLLAALCASALTFSLLRKAGWTPLLVTFTLFQVLHTLVLGQPTALFAMLPLVAGYVLWKHNQHFAAGLAWSTLWLKAQILLPLAVVIASWVLAQIRLTDHSRGEPGCLEAAELCAGFAAGTAALFVIAIGFFGFGAVTGWLTMLHEFTQQFIGKSSDFRFILAGSLPSAANVLIPAQYLSVYTDAIKPLIASAFLLLFLLSYKVMSSRLTWSLKQDILIILSIGALPLVSPYLRVYDLSLFLLILWMYLANPLDGKIRPRVKELLIVSWVGLDLYFCTFTWLPGSRHILLALLTAISLVYLRFCWAAYKLTWRAAQ